MSPCLSALNGSLFSIKQNWNFRARQMGPTRPPFPACHTQHCSNSGTCGGPRASSSSSSTWELIKNWNSLSRKTQTNECVCVWRGTIEKHKKHIERHRQSHTQKSLKDTKLETIMHKQQMCRIKKYAHPKHWDKNILPKQHWVHFVLVLYGWAWGLPLTVVCIPRETPLKKTNCFCCKGLSIRDSF